MAHNLNEINGRYSFASAKEVAWHGLGQIAEGAMTSSDALTLAGLDYVVTKQPMFIKSGKSNIEVPDKFATVRTDTKDILGVVGNRYHILQNNEAFDWFDNIVGQGEAYFETAGALGKGETVFITAKMPEHIKVGKDVVEQYLLLTNNHSGSSAIQMMFTPIRVVCQNTLNAAIGASKKQKTNKVVVRHTSGAEGKMKEAARAMGIANIYFEELSEALNAMSRVQITDLQLREYIRKSIQPRAELATGADIEEAKSHKTTEEMLEAVYVYATNDESQRGHERTLYGAYNSISGFYNNVKQWEDNEQKLKSIVDGRAFKAMQRGFDIAMSMLS